jgi:hypothetical protein
MLFFKIKKQCTKLILRDYTRLLNFRLAYVIHYKKYMVPKHILNSEQKSVNYMFLTTKNEVINSLNVEIHVRYFAQNLLLN